MTRWISCAVLLFGLLFAGNMLRAQSKRYPNPSRTGTAGAAGASGSTGFSLVDVGWTALQAKLTGAVNQPDIFDVISAFAQYNAGGGGPRSMGASYVYFSDTSWTGCRFTWIAPTNRTIKCSVFRRRGPTFLSTECTVVTTGRGKYSCTFATPLAVPAAQETTLMYGDTSGTDYSALWQLGGQQPALPSLLQSAGGHLGMLVNLAFTCTGDANPSTCSTISSGSQVGMVEPIGP